MLLAHENGAELIVSVGAHFNLTEFLDKNRAGMSSTFLTRLRIGETLVDAKGVSRLYNPGVRGWHMWAFLAVSLVLIAIVVLSSPALARVLRPRLVEDQGRAWTSDGLLGPLPRRLAGGRLPRARGRHPDRRRLRLRPRQRDRRRPRAEPRVRPRRGARRGRRARGASSPTERDFSERAVPRRWSTNRLARQRGRARRARRARRRARRRRPRRARARRGDAARDRVVREPPDDGAAGRGRAPAAGRQRDAATQELARASRRAGRALVRGGPRFAELRAALFSRYSGEPRRHRRGRDRARSARPSSSDATAADTDAVEDGIIAGIQGATPDRRRVTVVGAERTDTDPSSIGFFSDQRRRQRRQRRPARRAGSRSCYALGGAEGEFGVKETADRLLPDLLAPRARRRRRASA